MYFQYNIQERGKIKVLYNVYRNFFTTLKIQSPDTENMSAAKHGSQDYTAVEDRKYRIIESKLQKYLVETMALSKTTGSQPYCK